jgi:hypothetical protein
MALGLRSVRQSHKDSIVSNSHSTNTYQDWL